MSVDLASLIQQLERAVVARDGIPSDDQYEESIKDAVLDFAGRAPLMKEGTLSIVSGTSTYALASDYHSGFALQSLLSSDSNALVTDQGIVAVSDEFKERLYVSGNTLTIEPEPTYTTDRIYFYNAVLLLSVVSAEEVYADMTQDQKRIILLKARSICLGLQADKAAQEAWQYSVEGERVAKEQLATRLQAQSDKLAGQYLEAIKSSGSGSGIGRGVRAQYTASGEVL